MVLGHDPRDDLPSVRHLAGREVAGLVVVLGFGFDEGELGWIGGQPLVDSADVADDVHALIVASSRWVSVTGPVVRGA